MCHTLGYLNALACPLYPSAPPLLLFVKCASTFEALSANDSCPSASQERSKKAGFICDIRTDCPTYICIYTFIYIYRSYCVQPEVCCACSFWHDHSSVLRLKRAYQLAAKTLQEKTQFGYSFDSLHYSLRAISCQWAGVRVNVCLPWQRSSSIDRFDLTLTCSWVELRLKAIGFIGTEETVYIYLYINGPN